MKLVVPSVDATRKLIIAVFSEDRFVISIEWISFVVVTVREIVSHRTVRCEYKLSADKLAQQFWELE